MLNNIELINFKNLTLQEKKIVLYWRNTPNIQQWMYNNDDISLDSHLSFIKSLNNVKDKLYFLVKQDNDYIGVIDFVKIDKKYGSSEFGLYANTELRGMGKILLKSICEYGFNTLKLNKLIAETFVDNEKAISLYKKFNFKETKKKKVNDKEIMCMELKYEDR